MMNFGGPTAKRHLLYCNDAVVVQTVQNRGGYLPKAKREALTQHALVSKHVDRNGLVRQTGLKKVLKQSQHIALLW
jgi:hypothetical protein